MTFQGKRANLHAVWDYLLIQKRIRDDFNGSIISYFQWMEKSMKRKEEALRTLAFPSQPLKKRALTLHMEWNRKGPSNILCSARIQPDRDWYNPLVS